MLVIIIIVNIIIRPQRSSLGVLLDRTTEFLRCLLHLAAWISSVSSTTGGRCSGLRHVTACFEKSCAGRRWFSVKAARNSCVSGLRKRCIWLCFLISEVPRLYRADRVFSLGKSRLRTGLGSRPYGLSATTAPRTHQPPLPLASRRNTHLSA